jgi:iron complex transport system ATP-binding protein
LSAAIELEEASYWRYNQRTGRRDQILRAIDWTVEPGDRWVVLGPNGAGKSTLATIAAALGHPSSGTASVLGGQLGRVDMRALRERIGFLEPRAARRFSPIMTATNVVLTGVTSTFVVRADHISADDRRRALLLLEGFGCGVLHERPLGQLSQGERQRVFLARALVADPELLILDEPASALDLPGRESVVAALETIARDHPERTVVTVTHHPEEIPPSTTHALLLRDGAVTAQGPIDGVLTAEHMSVCFGARVRMRHDDDGRWAARVDAPTAGWRTPTS